MTRPLHPSEQFRSLGLIYQLVGEFVVPIVIGLVVDWLAGTGPWGTLVGAMVGVLFGGWRVMRLASRIGATGSDDPVRNERPDRGGSP